MRNVLLIRLPSYINIVTPPLGIGYLLKALDDVAQVRSVFVDAHRDKLTETDLLGVIKAARPWVVGLQVFSVNYAQFRRLVPRIRAACVDAKIIAGGPHVSGLPEQTLVDNPHVDYVVRGEGEEALRSLVVSLVENTLDGELSRIPNLTYRTQGGIRTNECRFIDVDKYGAPAWKALEPDKYPPVQHGTFHKSTRVVPILTSRGCPYPCTFCAGHLLTGKAIRRRSIRSIVDEIEFLQSSYGFEEFIIEDENFTFYKDHVVGLSDELRARNVKCFFSFPNGIRVDRLDEEVVHHLKRMGTYMVMLGIESGSPRTLRAMKKPLNGDMVEEKIRLLKRNGITVHGGFILGFSGEDMEDIERTIRFAIDCGVDTAYFGNYIPLPGSEDFRRMVDARELQLGEIDWDSYTSYYGRLPYHPEGVSEKDLLRAIRWGTIRFYSRPGTGLKLLRRMSRPVFLRSLFARGVSLFKGGTGNGSASMGQRTLSVGCSGHAPA
jgi:anaerobic magnesium-protoporphyrin IX monomethyl ester cyclase